MVLFVVKFKKKTMSQKMALGGLRVDTTFYPGLLYQEVGVVVVDKKRQHAICWTPPLLCIFYILPFLAYFAYFARHISNTSVQPSTIQYIPVQPSTAQYSLIQPSTSRCSPGQSSTAQYSLVPHSTT